MVKTGFGVDVHRLAEGHDCILGGVLIPSKLGLLGHSDADVVIHSIIDSLLGAVALGDIGQWFPDTDDTYKGIDSSILLKQVVAHYLKENIKINHIDVTILAQKPKIAPYTNKIREKLASILNTDIKNVSVKATTTEKLGFIGREEGITSTAVATVQLPLTESIEKVNTSKMSPMALAYMGDAVLELYVRKYLLKKGYNKGSKLQRLALEFVSAKSQAEMIRDNMEFLTDEERDVWRRGRNYRSGNVPKNTDPASYRMSSGLETLIGHIYFSGDKARLDELINILISNKEKKVEELRNDKS